MKLRALTNCLFSDGRHGYNVVKGDIIDVDVPQERVDWNSFELVEGAFEKPSKKKAKGE